MFPRMANLIQPGFGPLGNHEAPPAPLLPGLIYLEPIEAIEHVGDAVDGLGTLVLHRPFAFTRSDLRSLYRGMVDAEEDDFPESPERFRALKDSMLTLEFAKTTAPLLLLWSAMRDHLDLASFQGCAVAELLEDLQESISQEEFEALKGKDVLEFLDEIENWPDLKASLLALPKEIFRDEFEQFMDQEVIVINEYEPHPMTVLARRAFDTISEAFQVAAEELARYWPFLSVTAI